MKGQARVERAGRIAAVACPHLQRAVAQLDGLVDPLHDLVEACEEEEKWSKNFLLFPDHYTPIKREAPEL